jgi:outer membrane protein OmpA-like peptidoglycan-associated protein
MSLLVALLSLASLQDAPAGPPRFKILDIIYKVADLETKVRSLEVKETDTEIRIELAADVLFDFDKSNILPKAEQTLIQVADVIRERGKGTVRIEGHTDSKGRDAYNQRLSRQRADSVAVWLRKQTGLATLQFDARGLGATRPVAANAKPDGSDDPEGRQKNRRVEIVMGKT